MKFDNVTQWVIGRTKDPRAVDALVLLLKDQRSWMRSKIAEALGQIQDSRAVDALVSLLTDDPDTMVRCDAAEALGRIGDHRAVDALVSVLENLHMTRDSSKNTWHESGPGGLCTEVAKALRCIKDPRAEQALLNILRDSRYADTFKTYYRIDLLIECYIALEQLQSNHLCDADSDNVAREIASEIGLAASRTITRSRGHWEMYGPKEDEWVTDETWEEPNPDNARINAVMARTPQSLRKKLN